MQGQHQINAPHATGRRIAADSGVDDAVGKASLPQLGLIERQAQSCGQTVAESDDNRPCTGCMR